MVAVPRQQVGVQTKPTSGGVLRQPFVRYAIRRIGVFFLVVWAAASLNFILPRLAPGQDPVRSRLGAVAASGGSVSGIEEMVKTYQEKFGLNEPLWLQYVRYISDYARFDFGYSLTSYPARVVDLIARALPWTICLLLVSTLIAFVLGTLAGALLGWARSPGWLGHLFMPFLTLSAIPYYLLGLIMIYFLAFQNPVFPLSGGYSIGGEPGWSWAFVKDAVKHSFLPGCSIVLAQLGFWALGMRGMMVMTEGEDYMTYAEAKGLPPRTIFFRYGIRTALLPQTTSLALALGGIVSQAVLVEVVFGYPGIGTLLYNAIRGFDYFLIYGIVFLVIVTIGLTTLILDLIYPLLDPRITYQRQ
ncbi:MAG: peptide/nickel transport system permease protein [Thermomicrobiales bacterium]|jgi:peptide/nickel transport system permease protein|nr:peptide/nickel transport system permease protein [Thermomicrobiales bacterium]